MSMNKPNKTAHLEYLLKREKEMRSRDEEYIRELIEEKKFLLGHIENLKKQIPDTGKTIIKAKALRKLGTNKWYCGAFTTGGDIFIDVDNIFPYYEDFDEIPPDAELVEIEICVLKPKSQDTTRL